MTNSIKPTIKAQATTQAPAQVATKAPAKKALAVKAPKAQAPAPVDYAAQIAALADMIRNQNTRIDAYETQVAILQGQCTTLENVIVGMQTAQAQKAPAQAPAKTAQAPAPVEKALADDSWESVLAHTALCVRENAAADFFNDKVIPQTGCDLRVYLKTAQNKTFKVARTAAQISLVDAVNALEKAVNG